MSVCRFISVVVNYDKNVRARATLARDKNANRVDTGDDDGGGGGNEVELLFIEPSQHVYIW